MPCIGAGAMLHGDASTVSETPENRSAIVTGSTSGIGAGIARRFAACGVNVCLNGFGEVDAIAAQCAELAALAGAKVFHHAADLRRSGDVAAMVAAVEATFGAVDILVNNAGLQHVAPVEDFPIEQWETLQDVILNASFHAIKAVLPGMKRRHHGRIINLVSVHGVVASPFKSAYVAAKHGLVGLTRTVALEVAETAITCNAVCPGYVRTPLVEGQIAAQARAHRLPEEQVIRDVILAAQPSKRFVTVEEIAALVEFLCSDAARSINGAAIPIDGGWTAR